MDILKRIAGVRILVLGDLMLDRYWWGDVTRISPEAPVPVVRLNRSSLALGGAANVAVNIAGLGAKAYLVGCIGSDAEADLFCGIAESSGISSGHIVRVAEMPTTVKTRVIAHSQQVARIDQETSEPLSEAVLHAVSEKVSSLIDTVDAVVVSDYAKGVLTDDVLREAIKICANKGKPLLVDPKGKNYEKYAGSAVITPNRREAAEACGLDDDGKIIVDIAGDMLLKKLNVGAVLITEGEEGMTLFRRNREAVHMPTAARKVYDVTGAGDTVIATLASAVAAGADLEEAARLANLAAGIVVEQVGTSSISADQLYLASREPLSNERSA